MSDSSTQSIKATPHLRGHPLWGSMREFQRERLELFMRIHRELGEVGSFRLGPATLTLACSAALFQGLLGDNASKLLSGPFYGILTRILGRTSILALDGEHHKRVRRIMAPAFQPKRLMATTQMMGSCTEELQRTLPDESELDIAHHMHRLTLRIISRSAFNMEPDENDIFFKGIHIASQYVADLSASPLQLPLSWPTRRNRVIREAIASLRERGREFIRMAENRGEDAQDLLAILLNARDQEGARLTEEELFDQVLTIYTVGHDTAAKLLTWAWLMLARNPEVQRQLHAELDAVLGGRPPTYEDLPRLPYTLQVVKETLRMWPTATVFGRVPTEDLLVEGYRFRKGQLVLFCPYVLHRDPHYYPEPERFDPDRFSPQREKALPRQAFVPFGVGPHVCIGQHFAMLEIHLILAHLAQHFLLEEVPGPAVRALALGSLEPSPFKLKLTRRRPAVLLAG